MWKANSSSQIKNSPSDGPDRDLTVTGLTFPVTGVSVLHSAPRTEADFPFLTGARFLSRASSGRLSLTLQ